MIWWILAAVVVIVALGGWVFARRSNKGGHADKDTVVRTRGKDEGRGFGGPIGH